MAKGSVRKKGKKWYARFYIEDESGRKVQKEFVGTESKSETEALLRKAIADYEEKKFVNITSYIEERIFNETIIELDGRVNVIKDYKKDFEEAMKEQEDILKKISKLKATLYEKNNSFKLSDGRTIQDAIIDNTYLRRLKSSYDNMLKYKDSKKRITEVNNSYFDCYEVNYDSDEIRKKSKELEKQIQRTDFEISKLNSIEFEISL